RQRADSPFDRHDAKRRVADRRVDVGDETNGPHERIELHGGDVPPGDMDLAANPGSREPGGQFVVHEIESFSIRGVSEASEEKEDGPLSGARIHSSVLTAQIRVALADLNGHRNAVD